MDYEAVIGLEVHAQLLTRRKLFCPCPTAFGAPPNSQTCPVCLGHPGTLPVTNRRAVDLALRMGLAVGATIRRTSVFARKNYFYPDLPKGYQISQYDHPLLEGGALPVSDGVLERRIGITRIHLEEDAGKSRHPERQGETMSLIDLNRCGVPLMEIVGRPEIRSPAEAALFLATLRRLVQYLGVCDGNMEEGSLRCDANVSIRPAGDRRLGTRTEIKNLNSIRNLERALVAEIARQTDLVASGGSVEHATLLYDQVDGSVRTMRSKEEAHDYRYFPDPDLPPLVVGEAWIEKARRDLVELPWVRRRRFQDEMGLGFYDADLLTQSRPLADYFEACLGAAQGGSVDRAGAAKSAANWILTEMLRVLRERGVDADASPVGPERLAGLVRLVLSGAVSHRTGKELLEEMLGSDLEAEEIVRRKGWMQVGDEALMRDWIRRAFDTHPEQLERLVRGDEKIARFFIGEVMKASRGRADPRILRRILAEEAAARGDR